jgi:periplasmic protein TonB
MYDNLRKTMDFDDLLFKSRNRDYGAYMLRKKYNSVVIGGIIFATLLVSIMVILPFVLIHAREGKVISGRANYVSVNMENLEPPTEQLYIPPAPPPPQAEHVEEIVKYEPPVVVDTVLSTDKTLATPDQILNQTTDDNVSSKGTGSGDDLLAGADGSETDEPFYFVEVMPSFRGGDINKFRDWVQKRTNYPQEAIDRKIK